MDFCDCLLLLLALFIPPVPVLIKTGCEATFCLNVLLTFLGIIPGIVHAWYVICTHDDHHHHHHHHHDHS